MSWISQLFFDWTVIRDIALHRLHSKWNANAVLRRGDAWAPWPLPPHCHCRDEFLHPESMLATSTGMSASMKHEHHEPRPLRSSWHSITLPSYIAIAISCVGHPKYLETPKPKPSGSYKELWVACETLDMTMWPNCQTCLHDGGLLHCRIRHRPCRLGHWRPAQLVSEAPTTCYRKQENHVHMRLNILYLYKYIYKKHSVYHISM